MTARFWNALVLTRLKGGDADAFAQLVRIHQHALHRFCFRMLADAEEARDATQDIFMLIHRGLPTFRENARLSTWMYRIALNHCLNRKKATRRRSREGHRDPVEEQPPPNPEEKLALEREIERMNQGLKRLSDELRALVVFRDIEGLSYEDISKITELPEGTVKSRLHRARMQLAALMTAEDET